MKGYVLDGCTLLNLYCAWGSIESLKAFPAPFHLGTAVAAEIHYVREFDGKGLIVSKKMSAADLSRSYALQVIAPTDPELELTVRLSMWLDDGEAQGLALAASRGMTFCTDDGAVRKVVEVHRLRAGLASTPDLLQAWVGADEQRHAALPRLVKRVTDLGKFRPHRQSHQFDWWMSILAKASE